MIQLTVTTANICGNPIRARRAVRRRMRRALSFGGATFGQEVAGSNRFRVPPRGDYSTAWHRIARSLGKLTFGGTHEVPISLPIGWAALDHEIIKVHNGLRRVSPARYICVVTALPDPDQEPVAFVNCHPVSKPREGVDHAAWRIEHWNLYHAELVKTVAHLHDAGKTVVVGGDMNRVRVPQIHPDQLQVHHSGLDHLWVVPPAGRLVTVEARRTLKRTLLMDHPILSVRFTVH